MTDHQDQAKTCILGATGFVGKALMGAFQDQGVGPVFGPGSSDINLLDKACPDKLAQMLNEHTMLVVAGRAWDKDPWALFDKNLAMDKNLAKTIEKQPVKKLIYFSSLSVYDNLTTHPPITEKTCAAPGSLYGAAKFAGECLITLACRAAGIPNLILRPCKVYGPGDHVRSYGPTSFLTDLGSDDPVLMYGDGLEKRDHIFIDDLARITAALSLHPRARGVMNLASGISLSFRDILDMAKKVAGKTSRIRQVPRNNPAVDQYIDISRLKTLLPDFSFTSMETGLLFSHEHMIKQGKA